MRRIGRLMGVIIVAAIFMATIAGVGCSPGSSSWSQGQGSFPWLHGQVTAMEITSPTFSTKDGYSMLVLFERSTGHFLQAIRGTHDFVVVGDYLYVDDQELAACDVTKAGWGLYPEQRIDIPTEWDEVMQEDVEIPITMEELNLRDFEPEDLPQSGHFVRLDAIHSGDALKAEVSRPFYGKWYGGIRCLVTLGVYQSYQAGDIEIGDYLWVYYTNDPRPGHENQEIPIVVDKVMYP